MIFDALDGFAARLFNAASMHGMQMDSLADMVTFGVAPAVIVSVMAHRLKGMQGYYFVWLLCAVYLGCAALRLATYNVHAILEKKSSDKFNGLPSPGAAAAICSLVISFNYFGSDYSFIVNFLPFYAGILGLLMVSKIKYQHMAKWIQSVRRNPKRLTAVIIFLALMVWHPIFILTVAINAYVLSGPVSAVFRVLHKAEEIQPELTTSH
jgi:CDP-diacylglycerol--serine O-phosphatidyltransferase